MVLKHVNMSPLTLSFRLRDTEHSICYAHFPKQLTLSILKMIVL
jgi:hypothetical protein